MKKILLIEDDQLVGNIYRNKFAVEHYEVEIALDGESGLDLIRTFQPDAVILDLMLPKMSGLDLLKQIRADEKSKNLPVIVFSNTYLSNMVQEAWKAGATKCLSKANCTPKQVIEVVRSLSAQTPASSASAPNRPAAPAPKPVAADTESDAHYQADLRRAFLAALPASISACRTNLQAAARQTDDSLRVVQLTELYRRIHTLTGNAGAAGVTHIAHVSDALEALPASFPKSPAPSTPPRSAPSPRLLISSASSTNARRSRNLLLLLRPSRSTSWSLMTKPSRAAP